MPSASSVVSPWSLSPDPFLWLEALDDPDALAWVEKQNARTRAAWCSGVHSLSSRAEIHFGSAAIISIAGRGSPFQR